MTRAAAVELTALEHLRELGVRLMGSVVVMIVGGIIAYVFRLQIINYLQRPLGETLYYTSPTGSFQFIMQVCLLCGVILALPILIYNVLRFIEPAFAKQFSRRFVLKILCASMLLTAAGIAFGYYLTLPFALKFFKAVGTSTLHPLISVNEYFSFILGYLATFALVFQLPLVLLFINYITPFPPGGLTKWRRYIYIGAFAVSLIMPSSPDPLSQISLAIPIIALYEFSILLIWRVNRKKRRRAAKSSQVQTEPDLEMAAVKPGAIEALANYLFEPQAVEQASFSIARDQENMRRKSQQPTATVIKEQTAAPPNVAAVKGRAVRRSYQQPARRAALYNNPGQLTRAKLINDII